LRTRYEWNDVNGVVLPIEIPSVAEATIKAARGNPSSH
jgi:hypothetical protein